MIGLWHVQDLLGMCSRATSLSVKQILEEGRCHVSAMFEDEAHGEVQPIAFMAKDFKGLVLIRVPTPNPDTKIQLIAFRSNQLHPKREQWCFIVWGM
jgi:hypothetical protein